MDKVKDTIKNFTAKAGHADTTVHETVAPAVTHERVKTHEHEEINTAVDKEVHQDHYHRTVQPVVDKEVLPEQHKANIVATQHREFDHRDNQALKASLSAEQQQFKNERIVESTTHSESTAPTVGGEHVHHVCLHQIQLIYSTDIEIARP